jgi:hypothetical protein
MPTGNFLSIHFALRTITDLLQLIYLIFGGYMIKCLLTLLLSMASFMTLAQTTLTPAKLCQNIAAISATNGNACAQLISRNLFDQSALTLANKALGSGSSKALEVMNLAANHRLDEQAGRLCEKIMDVSMSNSLVCLGLVLDVTVAPELLRFSEKMLASGSSNSISVLQTNLQAYFYPPLFEICEAMMSVSASNSIACIQVIGNKISMNGAEQVCKTSLGQGSSYALQCLEGIVMDYVPAPEYPTTIRVNLSEIENLRKMIAKTQNQLNRGLTENAKRTLVEMSARVEEILTPTK